MATVATTGIGVGVAKLQQPQKPKHNNSNNKSLFLGHRLRNIRPSWVETHKCCSERRLVQVFALGGGEWLDTVHSLFVGVGVGLPCSVMQCGDVIYRSTLPKANGFALSPIFEMEDDDQWELCNEDGFVFKRKRRRIDAPPPPSEPDQEAAENLRRERKKQTLLKLKSKYEKEILQWESLSNTLRSMQQRSTLHSQPQPQPQPNQTLSLPSTSPSTDSAGSSLLHELLLQVEAQEAIIRDVSNLCDIAETVCVKREEQFKQTLFDLPIWASPLELMQVLCDGDGDDD